MPSLTGGDIIKGYYIFRNTSKKAEAFTSIAVDRICGMIALTGYAFGSALFMLKNPALHKIAFVIILATSVMVLSIIVFMRKSFWKSFNPLTKILERLKIKSAILKVYDAFYTYKSRKKEIGFAIVLSFIIQGMMIYCNYLIALSLGFNDTSFIMFLLIIPVAVIISALPISIAGWGLGEGAYKSLFLMLGPGYATVGVSISVLVRLGMLVFSLIGFPIYIAYKDIKIDAEELAEVT